MNNWISKVPQRYWAYLALSIWAILCFALLHKTFYWIDEGAAQALLLVWSVVDGVVSPVVTLGFPDFRTVFFAPIGFLWPGSIVAAKIATVLLMSSAAWSLYRWRQQSGDTEGAMLATGLLLVAPLMLDQIDTVSVAVYLLITFAWGAWLDQMYRETPMPFGGKYFAQLFLSFFCVTLHPAGLAYPLVLLWSWHKSPLDKKQRGYYLGGVGMMVALALLLTLGWQHVTWLANPVKSLSALFLGIENGGEFGTSRWLSAIGGLSLLLLVIWKQAGSLLKDFLGRMLLVALVIAVLVGDEIFAVVALVICLYWGLPLLLGKGGNIEGGFWRQRGVALALVMVISTMFMMNDKARYEIVQSGYLEPRDQLIKGFSENKDIFPGDKIVRDSPEKKGIRVASQWPARTMLACRCDALPLPPNAKDSDALFAMLKGINYILFDPRKPMNSDLSRNLAMMGAVKAETIVLEQGGVVIEMKNTTTPSQAPAEVK